MPLPEPAKAKRVSSSLEMVLVAMRLIPASLTPVAVQPKPTRVIFCPRLGARSKIIEGVTGGEVLSLITAMSFSSVVVFHWGWGVILSGW